MNSFSDQSGAGVAKDSAQVSRGVTTMSTLFKNLSVSPEKPIEISQPEKDTIPQAGYFASQAFQAENFQAEYFSSERERFRLAHEEKLGERCSMRFNGEPFAAFPERKHGPRYPSSSKTKAPASSGISKKGRDRRRAARTDHHGSSVAKNAEQLEALIKKTDGGKGINFISKAEQIEALNKKRYGGKIFKQIKISKHKKIQRPVVAGKTASPPLMLGISKPRLYSRDTDVDLFITDMPAPPNTPRSPSPPMSEMDFTEEQLAKPTKNYVTLIHETLTAAGCPLDIPKICLAMEHKYPWFHFRTPTNDWQSSVRHNLSQHDVFKKVGTEGNYFLWTVVEGVSIEKEKKQRHLDPQEGGQYPQQLVPSQTPSPVGENVDDMDLDSCPTWDCAIRMERMGL